MFLYLSNYVSSDSLFLSLSLIWFTLLLWILHRPTPRLITAQVIVLLLAFIVRYNALYYPLIAAVAFLMSRQSLRRKVAGIGASIIVIAIFVLYTSSRYNALTGIRQFTPFSGWQIANNAMYAYRYVDDKDVRKAPARFLQLDNMVRNYFDTSRNFRHIQSIMILASTMYMWDRRSPLQKYMNRGVKNDTASTSVRLKRWALLGPFYADYGSYLIHQYPLTFLKYFLWPNALKYYAPPGEFLDTYNGGKDSVHQIAQIWFRYTSSKVKTAFRDSKVNILAFLPIVSAIMNVVFVFGFVFFLLLNGLRKYTGLSKIATLTAVLWITNFCFSVFASPVTLRYQLFGILVFASVAILLVDYIYKISFLQKNH